MRILVTGAGGFIGGHCLRQLQEAGGAELHAVGRTARTEEGVRWHAADLRDPSQAGALVAKVKPTHLLHAAWIATPGVYASSPENLDWLTASVALARSFGETGGLRFVGIGSSAEYEAGEAPCAEDATPIRPASIYGKCKAACWLAVQAAAQRHGFSAAWGRLFLPYGPGDTPGRLIPSLRARLAARETVETTEGTQVRDFIFAPDAAALLVRLLHGRQEGAFNLGTGRGVAVREVIGTVADHYGARSLVRFGSVPLAPGEPRRLVADMAKVEREIEWSAPTGLAEGLSRTLAENGSRDTVKQTHR